MRKPEKGGRPAPLSLVKKHQYPAGKRFLVEKN